MNSTEWISKWAHACLGYDITEANMVPVRNFVLIWNIFETQCFENKAAGEKVLRKSFKVSKEISNSTFEAIRSRYVNDKGRLTDKYTGLFNPDLETGLERKTQEILLTEKGLTEEEKNIVCRIVIWRYRCNLFHGNKNAYYMLVDNSLFEYLNQYMFNIIEQQQL